MKENGEIELSFDKKEGKDMINIPISNSVLYREKTLIEIAKLLNKEMDGSFYISEFNLSLFNPNEINVLCNNCNNFNDIQYLIMEVKLSYKKRDEMILQLKIDESIISKLKGKKVLYLGVLGEDSDKDIIRINKVDFNCVIIAIKDSKLFNRNVFMFYDWELTKRVDNIENELSNIKNELSNLKNEIKIKFSNIKTELSELRKSLVVKKIKNEKKKVIFTKKKRKREKKDSKNNIN